MGISIISTSLDESSSTFFGNQSWEEYETIIKSDFMRSVPEHLQLKVQAMLDRHVSEDSESFLSSLRETLTLILR